MAEEKKERNRQIYYLREIDKMTFSRIAKKYSICIETVRSIYQREIWRRKDCKEVFYGLPTRARNGLSNLGIETKEELGSFLKSDEAFTLLDKVGLGMRSIKKILIFNNKLDKQIQS